MSAPSANSQRLADGLQRLTISLQRHDAIQDRKRKQGRPTSGLAAVQDDEDTGGT